jgi:hypothetical protein
MQPIEDVKEYFGEKIALYFAFIGQVGAFNALAPHTTPCVFSPFLQRSRVAPAAAFQSARLKRSVGCGAFRLQSLLLSAEAAHRALPGFHSCVLASAVHDDALYPRHHGPGALPHPGDRIPKADCFSGSVCCVSSCVLIFVGFCVCLFALVRHTRSVGRQCECAPMRAGVLDGHVAHAGQPIRADLLPLHRDLVNPTFRVPRALQECHEYCQSTTSTARAPALQRNCNVAGRRCSSSRGSGCRTLSPCNGASMTSRRSLVQRRYTVLCDSTQHSRSTHAALTQHSRSTHCCRKSPVRPAW